MTAAQPDRTAGEAHALLSDLLPVLVPVATFDGAAGEVLIPVEGGRARVSTRSLLMECAGKPQHQWRRLVEGWLREIGEQVAAVPLEQVPLDPSLLRLRLQAVPRTDALPAGVSAAFNSAFDLLLVEDGGGVSRRLQQPDLDGAGLSADEAVSVALDATISQVLIALDVRDRALPGGVGTVRMASADGVPYVSAGITSVPQLAGVDLPYGALVGVPRHSSLLILPVRSRRDLDTVVVLARLVASPFDSGVDPCARDVYWFVNDDAFGVQVQEVAGAGPRLNLPPAVSDLVAALPK